MIKTISFYLDQLLHEQIDKEEKNKSKNELKKARELSAKLLADRTKYRQKTDDKRTAL